MHNEGSLSFMSSAMKHLNMASGGLIAEKIKKLLRGCV